ncbi:hypothetical protein HYALB_00013300 [Hymenoscyphus albidus]|uniref:Uncharacterized protein n=1 Tax=Hymenoscyphus albidus TaxID=595503 RepID=A0A9N9M010_9HELO|nr:hypothetical protein HYALB_00013300 [Hymenoscyphus albidus]
MAPSQNNKKSRKGKGAGASSAASAAAAAAAATEKKKEKNAHRQATRNPRSDNRDAFRYRAKKKFFAHNQKLLGNWSAENLKALEVLVKKEATEKYAPYPLKGKAKAFAEAAEKAKEVDEDEDEDEDEDDEMEDEGDDDADHHLEDPSEDEDEGRRPAGNQSGVTAVLVS